MQKKMKKKEQQHLAYETPYENRIFHMKNSMENHIKNQISVKAHAPQKTSSS